MEMHIRIEISNLYILYHIIQYMNEWCWTLNITKSWPISPFNLTAVVV